MAIDEELDTQQPEGAPAEEPVAMPETIDDATLSELFGSGDPSPQPEAQGQEQPESSPTEVESSNSRVNELEQKVATLSGMLNNNMQQQQQQQQRQQPAPQQGSPEEAMVKHLISKNPSLDPEATLAAVNMINEVNRATLAPIVQRQQQTEKAITQQAQEQIMTDWNAQLDSLMDNANVPEGWERDAMRDRITVQGAAAQNQGRKMTKEAAAQLFRNLNNERLSSTHAKQQAYQNEKSEDTSRAAPVQTGTASGTAAETYRQRLNDPADKKMKIGGEDFDTVIKSYLNSALG